MAHRLAFQGLKLLQWTGIQQRIFARAPYSRGSPAGSRGNEVAANTAGAWSTLALILVMILRLSLRHKTKETQEKSPQEEQPFLQEQRNIAVQQEGAPTGRRPGKPGTAWSLPPPSGWAAPPSSPLPLLWAAGHRAPPWPCSSGRATIQGLLPVPGGLQEHKRRLGLGWVCCRTHRGGEQSRPRMGRGRRGDAAAAAGDLAPARPPLQDSTRNHDCLCLEPASLQGPRFRKRQLSALSRPTLWQKATAMSPPARDSGARNCSSVRSLRRGDVELPGQDAEAGSPGRGAAV